MTAEYQVHGDVAVITLNNPPVNGLGLATRRALVDGLEQAQADAAVRAIIISGAGKAFSGGADITEFTKPPVEPLLPAVVDMIEASSKPVVAAIHGTALGGGPRHIGGSKVWLLEEGTRPGELMPIEEDEHGTYILNSKDLRAIEHVQRLVDIGIDSLKIEGRTKSPYYVARASQGYRRAIDDAVAGRPFDTRLLGELEGLASRGYTDGFYQRHHDSERQNYLRGHSESTRSLYVGDVVGWDATTGRAEIDVKNRFAVGDRLEVIHPAGNRELVLTALHNAVGEPIAVAPGNGHRVFIDLPAELAGALLARFL